MQNADVTRAQVKALKNTLAMAEETTQIAQKSVKSLEKQGKQLGFIHADAHDVGVLADKNRKVVNDMRRNFFMRLCCYNRSDVVVDDPGWIGRESEEDQARVKKMIATEAMRRRFNRKKRREEQQRKIEAEKKRKGWKYMFSKDTHEDVSSDSDDDDAELHAADSELMMKDGKSDGDSPTDANIISNAPEMALMGEDPLSVDDASYDQDAALDKVIGHVRNLKSYGLEIGIMARAQTRRAEEVTRVVDAGKDKIDNNLELMGKLGVKKALEYKEKEFLTVSDKLALQTLANSVTPG